MWTPHHQSTLRRNLFVLFKYKTLAESIPFGLVSVIASSGRYGPVGLLAVYTLLVAIWFPFWLLALLLTEWGVYAILVGTVFCIGRIIVR